MADIDKLLKVLAKHDIYIGYNSNSNRFMAITSDGGKGCGSGDTALQAAADAIFNLWIERKELFNL